MWILSCITFVSVTVIEYAVVLFLLRQHRRRTQRKTLAVKSLVLQVRDGWSQIKHPSSFFREIEC